MSSFRIERIRLHNFKGVDDVDILLEGISAVIFGGKNGFGKTTIFDAIELVLTGKIARYSEYKDSFIDGRRAYSQEERPLVCSQQVEEVRIDIYVSVNLGDSAEYRRIFTRKARTADMKNPVDFDVFKELMIRNHEEENLRLATAEELQSLGLASFMMHYGRLNYMSQEESTKFIKSKDTKRVEDVQFLFNTQQFDRRINKIEKVLLKALKEKIDATTQLIKQRQQTIQAIQQYGVEEVGEEFGYKKMFQDGYSKSWDIERPILAHEEYSQILREGGLLDRMQEMIRYQEDFHRWKNNQIHEKWLEQSADYAFYLQYRSKEKTISLWKTFQQETVIPFGRLDMQHIAVYKFVVNQSLESVIGEERLNAIAVILQQVKDGYSAATTVQKAYDEMLEQRNRLANHLRSHAMQLSIQQCPLCGQSYETVQKFQESIENTLQLQLSSFEAINDRVSKNYEKLRAMISDVINNLNSRFDENGINSEIVTRYEALDRAKLAAGVKMMTDSGMLSELPRVSLEETESAFKEEIAGKMQEYDATLDYASMKEIYDSYVRYMPIELRTEETIQSKRCYLLQIWNSKKSQQMQALLREVSDLQNKNTQYNELDTQLKLIRDAIIEQKNAFLRKVITDVEILFYVYSGRIMQDSFYGRGLFMKNVQGKYIYFVSKYSSDFDALYKMSSGQLVALMLALLLSLNKLYSDEKFLAIDDPVQTIDDINVWGFVETIRHEFRDHQLFLSTHELSYGSFLRYKLSNMIIKAKYMDMMDLRKGSICAS